MLEKKIKLSKLLSLLFGGILFWGSAFLQPIFACSTCSQAPADLQRYFAVMDKLLAVLDTPLPEAGTGNQFVEDGKEIAFTTKSAIQSVASTTMIGFTLATHTAFLDMGGEIKTLAGTQARRRDREKLISYDHKIMMKGLMIGQHSYMGKNISASQLKEIDAILADLEFIELNKVGGSYVSHLRQATYNNILNMYRNLNYLHKKLHQGKRFHNFLEFVGSEYEVVDAFEKAETVEFPERETIKNFRSQLQITVEGIFREQQKENRGPTAQLLNFKENYKLFAVYVWQIQQDYTCAIGTKNQCDTRRVNTIKESRENIKGRTADFQKSMNMFSDALSRLKGALWMGDADDKKAANQREEALMQSFYGGQLPEKRKRFHYLGGQADVDVETMQTAVQDVENTMVGMQGITKRLRDAFKEETLGKAIITLGNSTRKDTLYGDSSLGAFTNVSNQPQDASQANAGKYLSKSEKEAAINKYVGEILVTRWADQDIQFNSVNSSAMIESQTVAISKAFTDVFALQMDREKESMFADVRSATVLFPVLSAAVWRNIELRGTKNEPSEKELGTIVNSAGKVCELQCSNLQGKCWYYTN